MTRFRPFLKQNFLARERSVGSARPHWATQQLPDHPKLRHGPVRCSHAAHAPKPPGQSNLPGANTRCACVCIFLKPVRRGVPQYNNALADMVSQPRAATVMGLLAEAGVDRQRGFKVSQKSGSVNSLMDRLKDWFVGNF